MASEEGDSKAGAKGAGEGALGRMLLGGLTALERLEASSRSIAGISGRMRGRRIRVVERGGMKLTLLSESSTDPFGDEPGGGRGGARPGRRR